jgi:hypothetical protein
MMEQIEEFMYSIFTDQNLFGANSYIRSHLRLQMLISLNLLPWESISSGGICGDSYPTNRGTTSIWFALVITWSDTRCNVSECLGSFTSRIHLAMVIQWLRQLQLVSLRIVLIATFACGDIQQTVLTENWLWIASVKSFYTDSFNSIIFFSSELTRWVKMCHGTLICFKSGLNIYVY